MPRINLARVVKSLVAGGQVNADAQRLLETTRANVEPLLIKVIQSHRHELLREVCVAILGERRNPRSIPGLLRALRDSSDGVRLEALSAIEKCTGLPPGELTTLLFLDRRKPREVVHRVTAWWNIVRSEFSR